MGLVALIIITVFFIPKPSGDIVARDIPKPSQSSTPTFAERPGVPVRLVIPSISVDATIVPVGVAADGTMDVKKDPVLTNWYDLGSRPGEKGSAVIAGHYGWDNGKGSVFDNLHSLKPGDELSVKDSKGASRTFVVRVSRSYDPSADATTIFRSNDNVAHLNLITCEGEWRASARTYSQRLVVFTDEKQ